MKSEDWKILLDKKKFDFRNEKQLYEWVRMSVYLGLSEQEGGTRKYAWSLMLGIDASSQEYTFLKELYQDFLKQQSVPGSS